MIVLGCEGSDGWGYGMRAVVQRVSQAKVTVDGEVTGSIGLGLVVLLGVGDGDEVSDLEFMERKLIGLRVFEDDQGKMNLSIGDVGGSLLLISQFTLYGDCRKGNRPSFTRAAVPAEAVRLYEELVQRIRQRRIPVETGVFQAMMEVSLVNEGPVTLIIDSRKEVY